MPRLKTYTAEEIKLRRRARERLRQARLRKDPAYLGLHNERVKAWNKTNHLKVRENVRRWKLKNPDKVRRQKDRENPGAAIRGLSRQLGSGSIDVVTATTQIRELLNEVYGDSKRR